MGDHVVADEEKVIARNNVRDVRNILDAYDAMADDSTNKKTRFGKNMIL